MPGLFDISLDFQDLFVPPYIKDRCSSLSIMSSFLTTTSTDLAFALFHRADMASTSPPSSKRFISTSASSVSSGLPDYEVDVVEIRVREGELEDIIP
jgi:hypothetical protein